MVTFFTTAKPFLGHDGVIQRNALKSWKLLHPDVEVILFGDDDGAAEACAELELVHHPVVERHESGTKRLDHIFRRANEIGRHNYLCYSNCDIVLMEDFWRAFEKARAWRERFLLVSQRWDMNITAPIDFGVGWGRRLRIATLEHGVRQNEYWIDFFLFRKGLYVEMPPLIVGHCYWDNWMIWKAQEDRVPVVDASRCVVPVHQNHRYSKQYGRIKGEATDDLSKLNLELIGGPSRVRVIRSATHRLSRSGCVMSNTRLHTDPVLAFMRRVRLFGFYRILLPVWHSFLHLTRPVRAALGLRSKAVRARGENQP
jgi:hypothetical protein